MSIKYTTQEAKQHWITELQAELSSTLND